MIVGIPMKTTETIQFISTGEEIAFDFSRCEIKLSHAMQYLAYLKVSHTTINITPEVVLSYMKCPWLLGKTNLVDEYKNLLCMHVHGHQWVVSQLDADQIYTTVQANSELLDRHLLVLRSIPLFLSVKSSGAPADNQSATPKDVGVNFARLFEDPAFLSYLLGDAMDGWKTKPYFTELFDDYKFGGTNLVWFVVNNPDCEITKRSFV